MIYHPDPPTDVLTLRSRYRQAAQHAKRAYPGPVGQLLSREIASHEEFGYLYDRSGLMGGVVEQVLNTPITEEEAA